MMQAGVSSTTEPTTCSTFSWIKSIENKIEVIEKLKKIKRSLETRIILLALKASVHSAISKNYKTEDIHEKVEGLLQNKPT